MKRLIKEQSKSKMILVLSIIMIAAFLFNGCSTKEDELQATEIKIAQQYGLAYAPVQIMKDKGILEKNLPDSKITWEQMGNTAAIREAMVSNKLDIGFMAIPPFLIGQDKGMEWKIASGLSSMPLGLVAYKYEIQDIKDFSSKDRIALPQPGSIQHILLSMACEKEFGDATKLDNQLVSMAHPDGMNALLSLNDIAAHFTSPPYIFKELQNEDFHEILSGEEAMGTEFTFIVGVTTKEFHDEQEEAYKAFVDSLNEAIDFINNNTEEAAEILAIDYDLPKEEVLEYLSAEGVEYNSNIRGLKDFADFMERNQYISETVEDMNEVLWEDTEYEE